jgi:hypothetical protein
MDDRLEAATARRLGRLRTMPVDTSRLESRLGDPLGTAEVRAAETPVRGTGHGRVYAIFHSVRTMAASVAALFLIGAVVLYVVTAPVSASAQTMAQLHQDLVSGRTPAVRVDSIEAANRELAAQWPEAPGLPGVPQEHVMACCMKSVQHKRVACVLLNNGSTPVTMTVANASDVRPPDSPTVERGGVTYHTHAAGGLNMVSTVRGGRYVCLIGSVPTDRLIELAGELRF